MSLVIDVQAHKVAVGAKAAKHVADTVRSVVASQGCARVIFATGASQFEFLHSLTCEQDAVPWDKVTAFHLDEYCGMSEDHPASFRGYLQERLFSKVQPPMAAVHLMPAESATAAADYQALLLAGDIDLACIGVGENGHIAFNDPPVCDFNDAVMVKEVELDAGCKAQQVGEGWFPTPADVPNALTLTVPAIMRAKRISCVVPDSRKADAIRGMLHGPVSHACPASVLRRHPDVKLWLDSAAAALSDPSNVGPRPGAPSTSVQKRMPQAAAAGSHHKPTTFISILLMLGGVIGKVSSGSNISLVAGVGSGGFLFSRRRKPGVSAVWVSMLVAVVMAFRWRSTGKFMPAGLVALLGFTEAMAVANTL